MEIRRYYDRLISTMGFPILVRWHIYIESGPKITEDVMGPGTWRTSLGLSPCHHYVSLMWLQLTWGWVYVYIGCFIYKLQWFNIMSVLMLLRKYDYFHFSSESNYFSFVHIIPDDNQASCVLISKILKFWLYSYISSIGRDYDQCVISPPQLYKTKPNENYINPNTPGYDCFVSLESQPSLLDGTTFLFHKAVTSPSAMKLYWLFTRDQLYIRWSTII